MDVICHTLARFSELFSFCCGGMPRSAGELSSQSELTPLGISAKPSDAAPSSRQPVVNGGKAIVLVTVVTNVSMVVSRCTCCCCWCCPTGEGVSELQKLSSVHGIMGLEH